MTSNPRAQLNKYRVRTSTSVPGTNRCAWAGLESVISEVVLFEHELGDAPSEAETRLVVEPGVDAGKDPAQACFVGDCFVAVEMANHTGEHLGRNGDVAVVAEECRQHSRARRNDGAVRSGIGRTGRGR